jgi:hypothetical protein
MFSYFCRLTQISSAILLLVLTIDALGASPIKAGWKYRGFVSEVAKLDTDMKYLVHLMLHEIACHVLRSTEQELRDKWAFERVSKYAI